MQNNIYNKIFFDFDSTIIAGESLDMLAARRSVGPAAKKMTRLSMNGNVDLVDVLRRKMDLMSPSKNDIDIIVAKCKHLIVDGIRDVVDILHNYQKEMFILSANFHCLVDPVAQSLGIARDQVIANDIYFKGDKYNGINYKSSLCTTRGKAILLKQHLNERDRSVMVGDSVSDLFCREVVDLFVGFGGVEQRPIVQKNADIYIADKNILSIIPFLLSAREMQKLSKNNKLVMRKIERLTTTTISTDKIP